MANYPFKINITTKDNTKMSFYTGSFATSTDTVVSASVMVDRINNMKSGSNFVDSIEAPTSLATHPATFYGETGGISPTGVNNGIKWLSASFDHPNTGSITFTDTETAASGGLDFYTFHGTKVCSVLGLPEGIPIYTENFKLSDSSTDTTNYISGEFVSDRVALKKGFKMSPQARVQSNLVWDHAFGEGFIQWVSGSDTKMSMGYNNVDDVYRITSPNGSFTNLTVSNTLTSTFQLNAFEILNNSVKVFRIDDTLTLFNPDTNADLDFAINGDNTTIMFFDAGNDRVSLGSTTNAGKLLQVNGTSKFTGQMHLGDISDVSASIAALTAGGADNLGNHIAAQDLDMAGYNIDDVTGIYGNNDTNTHIVFSTDAITFTAGNEALLTLTEATQDVVKIGDGGDVDINFNDDAFMLGSNSCFGIGTTTPQEKLTVEGNISASGNIQNDDGYALFKRTSTGTNSVLNVRQLSTGTIAEFGTSADTERVLIEAAGNITADGTGSFAGLVIGGGTFTSASLAAGGSGGGAVSAVANGADDRIATFSSADALNGEANFTFDGDATVNFNHADGMTLLINTNDSDFKIQSRNAGSMKNALFFDTSTGRMSIGRKTSGAGGATSSPVATLHSMGDIFADGNISGSSSSTGSFGTVESATNVRAEGDVIAFYSSDERLKDNIKKIEKPIYKLKQLRGVEYEWNNLQGVYPIGSKDSGIIAQDVQKVLPQLVKEKKDGYLGVRHDRLVGLLVESIKEQQEQIDELKKEVQELKNGSS
tara:strand:- start:1059 stop:3353 length:2295 start_codon:yes stop_codon:yes gene_type:complete